MYMQKRGDKSLDQVLEELKEEEVGQGKHVMETMIKSSLSQRDKYKDDFKSGIEQLLERIRNSDHEDDIDVLSSCLSVVSMALYICKGYWPLNTQLVSYCLLVVRKEEDKKRLTNEKGRLLEILTGEGKSGVIAMVAATYALLGRTVDVVTSSPELSLRDAGEWREFYTKSNLSVSCNVDEIREGDASCYESPIVYGTVETFARDILKTEFLLQEIRKNRKCDIVIVDEVDSMLIYQGVQCTYLSHDFASVGMCHFEPILGLIWMHVSRLSKYQDEDGVVWYETEPEVFLATLSHINKDIDPLQMLRLAEEDESSGIRKGFTDEYFSKDIKGQETIRQTLKASGLKSFFQFALTKFNLEFDIRHIPNEYFYRFRLPSILDGRMNIAVGDNGLSLVSFEEHTMKDRLTENIIEATSNQNESIIDLPVYLRDYINRRFRHWIANAFLAKDMQPGREYIAEGDAIYPVDYESTGVIEINKK